MQIQSQPISVKRYELVSGEKATGSVYTPRILADFVAQQIVDAAENLSVSRPLRIFDPAVGEGELLVGLLNALHGRLCSSIEVFGFETNEKARDKAADRIRRRFPDVELHLEASDFLEFISERFKKGRLGDFLHPTFPGSFDLVIANPPYVRTQILGGAKTRPMAENFGLSGRIDLYYTFLLGLTHVLDSNGTAGIIVSNRFMTIKAGASVRKALLEKSVVRHIWDLGDTKLFDSAVLPAVLLVGGRHGAKPAKPAFTSIYETNKPADKQVSNPIDALCREGVLGVEDGRRFLVQQGTLHFDDVPEGVWRIAAKAVDDRLSTVRSHTWGTFRDIGKIRVGVKTCADKVYLRSDWHDMPESERPELLRPVITHHVARCFKARPTEIPSQILYPHEAGRDGKKAVDLMKYPRTRVYLERHRQSLENRKYVLDAGRNWYEIWVPQDPGLWKLPKLVFRDIAEKPTFWIDLDGAVVNGDCYWLVCRDKSREELLWLAAAVANSSFIEFFYDACFRNKLYAGRRRFMTQYVEAFPLPDPQGDRGKTIVAKARRIYECLPSPEAESIRQELDRLVWHAFGLVPEEV